MSLPVIRFRDQVREDDAAAVAEILRSSGFFHPDEIGTAVELVEERLARGEKSGYYFLFAEEDDRTIGYTCFGPIACTQGSYDLFWIAVHGECRGKGTGKMLLRRTEEIIRTMNGRRIYIETSSREQYTPTRGFYLKCGYRQEAVLDDFYAPGDGKVIYVKALD